MLPPEYPEDEALRLNTLRECRLLDTLPEERFDRITRLARQIFHTEIALISLIDEERQWFKSRQGLQAQETHRDISFCGHAILSGDVYVVEDASKDLRFSDNPLVLNAPFIRFYAGAPLHTKNGQRIGTLCIIDSKARILTTQELSALRDLADCVEHEIDNEQAHRQHDALLTLARITSLTFDNPQTLLRETLALGCEYLKLSTGIISKHEGDNIYVSVLQSSLETLSEGHFFPKNQTYSDLLKVDEGVVCIEHIGKSQYRHHPSYQRFRQETYIGIPLFLEGQRYGTLGFSDNNPRASAYSEIEIEFINVLGDWVNSTLKRLALDRALEQQQKMNDAVARAQSQFIKGRDKHEGIRTLLNDAVLLTGSNYGQVCEVRKDKAGHYFLKNHIHSAIPGNANAATSAMLPVGAEAESAPHLLTAHFEEVLRTRQPLSGTVNTALTQAHSGPSAPAGRFLCMPVHYNGDIVAMIGVADSSDEYDQQTIDFLQPVLITIGQLINAAKVQRQHEESERRLANIIEGTNIGTWECDIASGETIYNERWAEMLGYTLEELQPTTVQTWLNLCHPDDLKRSSVMLNKHFNGELPYFDMISRMRHKDGHWVWIRDRGCVVSWSEDGKPLVMSGSHQDVTQERLAEEKLAHAYELLEQSNTAARIGTWEFDIRHRQVFWSQVTKQIHEVGDDYVHNLDSAVSFYKPGKNRDHLMRLMQEAVTDGKKFDEEFEIITAKKKHCWVRVIGLPYYQDDQIVRIYGIFQDISDSKANAEALRDQAAHTEAILDNVLDGIVTIDHTGRIDGYNAAAAKIFGYDKEEVIGQHFNMLLPARNDGSRNRKIRQHTFEDGIGVTQEIEAQRKDGSVFPLDLSVSTVRRRGHPLYIGLVRDITERKRVERIKNEFISTVSHELRTPLTSISGALGLVLGGATGTLPKNLTPLLTIASKNSQRLTFLINDLLDMEKLSAGQMHFNIQKYPLAHLLSQALEGNLTFGTQRKIHLRLLTPVPDVAVAVDSQRLMQILSNLLSNAIKYSPENETVEISAATHDNAVRISVRDHGEGIPAEFHSRIFQKFAQADSSNTREKGGTGLGLAISRELVEHMGGSIGFESGLHKGAHFYIDLPITELRPQTVASE